jgi:hypothetical protein
MACCQGPLLSPVRQSGPHSYGMLSPIPGTKCVHIQNIITSLQMSDKFSRKLFNLEEGSFISMIFQNFMYPLGHKLLPLVTIVHPFCTSDGTDLLQPLLASKLLLPPFHFHFVQTPFNWKCRKVYIRPCVNCESKHPIVSPLGPSRSMHLRL